MVKTICSSMLLLLAAAACDRGAVPEPEGDGAAAGAAAAAAPTPRYSREYVFLGLRNGEPLVVPFAFRATDSPEGILRVTRAWLAHGPTWEGFLAEDWLSPAMSGVWRVLPRGNLRISAAGPNELESLWYESGARRLRVRVGAAFSGWVQGDDARFRVQQGILSIGEETVPGAVLQLLEVRRPVPSGGEPEDWLFLSGGDSLRLVLAHVAGARDRFGSSLGWTGQPEGERAWDAVEVDWRELRPIEEARRDVPLGWGFRIPAAGIQGEVEAMGYEITIGEERAGRREVEVRYTVEGWAEIEGRRIPVKGTVRHTQG